MQVNGKKEVELSSSLHPHFSLVASFRTIEKLREIGKPKVMLHFAFDRC